jgi:hypothetical protein
LNLHGLCCDNQKPGCLAGALPHQPLGFSQQLRKGVSAMKRLAFLSFAIATLLAPITVQAQTGCVRFPQRPNAEAELRFLLSHPGTRVCPAAQSTWDPGQSERFRQGLINSTNSTIGVIRAMNGAR